MNRDELLELAERCEAASGPDREIDRGILSAIGTHVLEKRGKDRKEWWYPVSEDGRWATRYSNDNGGYGYPPPLPRYTASLDAAMRLPEEGDAAQVLNDAIERLGQIGWKGRWRDALPHFVTAAALRALASKERS